MFYLYINIFYKNYHFYSSLKIVFICLTLLISAQLSLGQSSLNISLLDKWHDSQIISNSSEAKYNDCWGYVQNGIEYAILGSTEGIHIFEITNDDSFRFIQFIEGKFSSTTVVHRDMKIFQNYLYTVCDEGESSLQIIDLSSLPNPALIVSENDSTFSKVHNLFIDQENELMYACAVTPKVNGVQTSLISMQVFSLADPTNPTLVYTGPNDIPEVHDIYVKDNIAYLNCGFDGLRVYDFSIASSPVFLQNQSIYQEQGYNHQGWVTPDGETYIFADETNGKKVKKCSVNTDKTINIKSYFGTNTENNSVPHNIMLDNNFAFIAYYNEGLRVYDLKETSTPEIAHFDTYPTESNYKLNGAWGVYSHLPSGRLLVSDRQNGLFLFDFNQTAFLTSHEGEITVYPSLLENNSPLTIKVNDNQISSFQFEIFDINGRLIHTESINSNNYVTFQGKVANGTYSVRVTYENDLGDTVMAMKKIIVY